jgi:hypothetical protein
MLGGGGVIGDLILRESEEHSGARDVELGALSFGCARPIKKTSENRSFLTLTQNFSTKIQNRAKMDGTIRFALLFFVRTNHHFLILNRLLSRHHAFKGGG